MRYRCRNPSADNYRHYGGRGIRVCDRWEIFQNFLDDMGVKPSGAHTIDRIDNDCDYEPSNCRWATPKEQNRNRSTTRMMEWEGKSVPLGALCETYGIRYGIVQTRMARGGWDLRGALTEPLRKVKSPQRRRRSAP